MLRIAYLDSKYDVFCIFRMFSFNDRQCIVYSNAKYCVFTWPTSMLIVVRFVYGTCEQMARSKKACIVFFDEVDAIGGARFDDGLGGDNEVQRTMLEIVNQLDGFDARGNIKVLMATNR